MSNDKSIPSTFEAQLQALEQRYTLHDAEQVQRILHQDPSLVALLLGAYPSIIAHFPDAHIFLHAAHDPEPGRSHVMDDEQQEITAFISTRLAPPEAIERLKALYQSDWEHTLQAVRSKIAVGLECL